MRPEKSGPFWTEGSPSCAFSSNCLPPCSCLIDQTSASRSGAYVHVPTCGYERRTKTKPSHETTHGGIVRE